ncbi:dihydrodipicolinate synthase family protein [Dinghuibacter silviterrae]|uniref:4-hydroxy-tetrahydrodipicolinate synthase n=1 Tax=Dinghuibacter silviterrae TaxID=1539049 RepID=A0A4V3GLY6_9BACT|nr:dihydrodipicolinate synthase family protein [Dinghuibacter silviterrae]TDX01393.1 4-hydroxy-tetrahydrodipicolinate synthase [Dinghuibacter silviterrae]
MNYSGVVVPAITPLEENGLLDEAAVERLWERFEQYGVDPFILGTTGEGPSLSLALKSAYIRLAGRLQTPRQRLFVGIGSACLEDSLALAFSAFEAGADAVVSTLPSYYALEVDDMRAYFLALADRVGGPLFIYNIPSTTHMSIPLSLVDELSGHPNIVGMKDSERGEERLFEALRRKPEGFCHLLGWSARSALALELGSNGLVPSSANLSPRLYRALYEAARAGQTEEAARLQKVSDALGEVYQKGRSLGASLAAMKAILAAKGICGPQMAPPLRAMAPPVGAASPLVLSQKDIDLINEWI